MLPAAPGSHGLRSPPQLGGCSELPAVPPLAWGGGTRFHTGGCWWWGAPGEASGVRSAACEPRPPWPRAAGLWGDERESAVPVPSAASPCGAGAGRALSSPRGTSNVSTTPERDTETGEIPGDLPIPGTVLSLLPWAGCAEAGQGGERRCVLRLSPCELSRVRPSLRRSCAVARSVTGVLEPSWEGCSGERGSPLGLLGVYS